MAELLSYLFGAAAFMPHGYCLLWRPDLVAMHVVGDGVIAASYFSIPAAILVFLRRRPDVEFGWVGVLFATFIVACGLTHVLGLATLWWPIYGFQGLFKLATAGISLATAVVLWPAIPRAVALPSPAQLRQKTAALEAEVARREASEAALRESLELKQAILSSIDHVVIATGTDGTITQCNPAAEAMLGYAAAELVGRADFLLIHDPEELAAQAVTLTRDLGTAVTPGFGMIIARHCGRRGKELEWTYVRKDGSRLPVAVSLTALRSSAGIVTGYLVVAKDITERRRVEAMQRDFISTVSHELRTPMTSIAGSLGLLAAGVVKQPEMTQRLITTAHSNCLRLVRLINDILDLEKLDGGKMHFIMGPLRLGEAASSAIGGLKSFADKHDVTVVLDGGDEDVAVNADADRIEQVLTNLLSNAIKYSPADGVVSVTIRHEAAWACLAVRDHGRGIPEAFRSRMFTRFAQAEESDARRLHSTGLGLAIVKEIVERHGGTVGYESAPGGGTIFRVALPLADPTPEPDAAGTGPAPALLMTPASLPA